MHYLAPTAGTPTHVSAVLCTQMIPHLLSVVASLESGQGVSSTMVSITGRAVDRHNSDINGWYTAIAPYNGRNAYYKRTTVREGKKETVTELFLWWNADPTDRKWCISAELGSALVLACNADNVENAEAIAKTWMVRTTSADGVADDYNADDAVVVGAPATHIFSYRHKLLDLVVELTRCHVACEVIAKNCHDDLVILTQVCIGYCTLGCVDRLPLMAVQIRIGFHVHSAPGLCAIGVDIVFNAKSTAHQIYA